MVIGQTMLYENLFKCWLKRWPFKFKCCPSKLKLVIDSEKNSGTTQISDSEHIHDEEYKIKHYGIQPDVKELILKLDKMHLKPKAILRNLRDVDSIQIPSIMQLNNFLTHVRDKLTETNGSAMCLKDF